MTQMAGRTVAWIGGAAVLVTWFVAAAGQDGPLTPEPSPPPAAAPPSESERAAREIESQAARLRSRLGAAPAPAEAGRNPFLFARRAPEPRRLARPISPAAGDLAMDANPIVEPDPFTLSGIATDDGPDGPVRTAVLSGLGDVFLAKAGDTVASRYVIVAVGADAVELNDLATGRGIRIGLR
jgi:hypothetical protein